MEVNETKQVIIGRVTLTREGVKIEESTVLCLTPEEEALVGSELDALGFQRLNRDALVKELAKHTNEPLFLDRI